jgi:hypothetical protein
MAKPIMAMYALDKSKSMLCGLSKMPQAVGSFLARKGANKWDMLRLLMAQVI